MVKPRQAILSDESQHQCSKNETLFSRGGDGQTPIYPDILQTVGESLCLLFLLFIVDVVVEHRVGLIH